MSPAGRALGWVALALVAAIAPSCRSFPGDFSDHGIPDFSFRLLGEDPARMVVQRPSGDPGRSYAYRLHREDAGTTETLHAATLVGRAAFAVGDHGVVVRRGYVDAWTAERSGTDRALRAIEANYLGIQPFPLEDGAPDPPLVAVGDGGTVLRRSTQGAWSAEPSGTTRDLFAVHVGHTRVLAAGDGGTLIARRSDGIWYPIDTHTEAALLAFTDTADGQVLVGRGGAVIVCGPWKEAVNGQPACSPARSPSHEDLVGLVHGDHDTLWALGAAGTVFRASTKDAIDFVPVTRWAPRRPGAVYRGLATVAGELCAVGARGSLIIAEAEGTLDVTLPGAPELTAATMRGGDAFLVGERGTIVHAHGEDERGTVMYAVQQ